MTTLIRHTKNKLMLAGALFILLFASCIEKHDFFDDMTITGEVGPQAYWETASAAMSAGGNMDFTVQYYSTVSEIDHSEVWYNLIETQEKSVTCPWVVSFTYSINSTKSEEKRISQKIQEYPHSLAVWSDSLHAYTFKAQFPVSNTLAPLPWDKPEQFDSTKMDNYFGVGFMQHFKDSLYNKMQFADFKNMMLSMGLLEDFQQYTDSTYDHIATINSGSADSLFVYHFPKDENGNTPVPDDIRVLYESIPFEKLIETATGYNVVFKRSYAIEAILRVYDKRGVYGTTTLKKIEVI